MRHTRREELSRARRRGSRRLRDVSVLAEQDALVAAYLRLVLRTPYRPGRTFGRLVVHATELERSEWTVADHEVESGFIQVAAAFAVKRGIEAEAWRRLRVPPSVIRLAGLERPSGSAPDGFGDAG
jgi:hypothetical protein